MYTIETNSTHKTNITIKIVIHNLFCKYFVERKPTFTDFQLTH